MNHTESKVIMTGVLDAPTDGFIHYAVTAAPSFNGCPVATMTVCGWPVMVIDSEDGYSHTLIVTDDPQGAQAQSLVSFLYNVGEASEDHEQAYQADMSAESLNEIFDNVEGHELLAFVGRVAEALHAAFPEDTPEVTGF